MGLRLHEKIKGGGQQHSNACWAASISWWTAAMSLHYKRTIYAQTELLAEYGSFPCSAAAEPAASRKIVLKNYRFGESPHGSTICLADQIENRL
jgi:hypothetical protein